MADAGDELIDYEEEEETTVQLSGTAKDAGKDGATAVDKGVKKGYVGIHSTGFRDFLLKPELLRAIADCGFEHPSEGFSRVSEEAYNYTSPARMYTTGPSGYGCHLPS